MNLHDIVRRTITAVADDRDCLLFRSTGKTDTTDRGVRTQIFSAAVPIRAQFQSLGADRIEMRDRLLEVSTVRRVYLYADGNPKSRPWAMWRPLARSGDYIQDDRCNFWLVDAVLEDFSEQGWVSVQAIMQTVPVKLTIEGE